MLAEVLLQNVTETQLNKEDKMRLKHCSMCVSVAICLLVSGCAASSGSSFCDLATAISPSVNDTDDTLRQIADHNDVGIAICDW